MERTDGRAVRGGHFAPGVVPSDLASLLRACLPHLKGSLFFKNCVSDMCKFQRLESVLCTHMAALTEICQDAGYAVKPWRGPQFCREFCQVAGPLPSRASAQAGGTPGGTPLLPHAHRESCSQKHPPRKITVPCKLRVLPAARGYAEQPTSV